MDTRQSAAKYDGPFIDGHPALSIDEVRQWFRKFDRVVPDGAATAIAQMLNHCAFLESQWKNTSEFKKARRSNASILRAKRVDEALSTLQRDLPVLIEDTLRVYPKRQPNQVDALLDLVNLLAPGFQK